MGNDKTTGAIGVFDSGYGGLSILREICDRLPDYDYIYLGDNARAPYGTRSFELVYQFTLQAVRHLFDMGCPLVILACNTASAKALRTIQQHDLPVLNPNNRVLGVIRPTVEALGHKTGNGNIGIFGTPGTVSSKSYELEIEKLYPEFKPTAHACPMWVPLVENGESEGDGADYFVKKEIDAILCENPDIDTFVLACTHYPLLIDKIRKYTPDGISLLSQGEIVADSLADYLQRHPELDCRLSRGGTVRYMTTEQPDKFNSMASLFMKRQVDASKVILG